MQNGKGMTAYNFCFSHDASILNKFAKGRAVVCLGSLVCVMGSRGWPLGGLLEAVLKPLGGRFGASWEPVGGLLGASWEPLGASWGPLGRSWGAKLSSSCRLEASWGHL